jgi:hypothetical protein
MPPLPAPRSTSVRVGLATAAVALVPLLSACEDDPFGFNDWSLSPDTVFLYSLARPELNLPSGFNLNTRQLVRVEAAGSTGTWDFLVNTVDGQMVFITPTAVGLDTSAGIAVATDETFDGIREAPRDTARYVRAEPVPIVEGRLYVVRTNQQTGQFGRSCTYYGKVEPLEVDVAGGTLRFRFDSSPLCNSRALVPPEN